MARYLLLLASTLLLTSCGLTGNLGRNYGKKFPLGTKLDCASFRVTSFDERLRSSPNAFGKGTFVGYQDYGPGMSRGTVFLVLPLRKGAQNDLASTLVASDPKKRDFWKEGRVLTGSLASGSFVFLVPADWTGTEQMKVVNRSEIVIQGSVLVTSRGRFFVLSQEETLFGKFNAERLEKEHRAFLQSLQFNDADSR